MARLDRNAIRRSEDCFVDELFGAAVPLGAPMLAANFPRAYIDVNREPWELDPRMFAEPVPSFANIRSARVAGGLGTMPKLVGEGLDIYSGRLPLAEALGRIEAVYKPYHDALKRLITAHPCAVRLRRAGRLPFDAGQHPHRRQRRAAGLHRRRSLRRLGFGGADRACDRPALAMGYTVAHNKPYAGGFITEHYGRPAAACTRCRSRSIAAST